MVPLGQGGAEMLGQGGKKGVVHTGKDDGDGVGLAGPQAAGVLVDLVSQLFRRRLHPEPVAVPHGDAVEYLGDSAQGHTGLLGNILHGWE